MNTLEILIARESDLESRHLIHAAKRGLLIEILTSTSLAADDYQDWSDIWTAHTDAGHSSPDYEHAADDDVASERGCVWGCDTLTAFGQTHEIGWSANYGGNNPGWNGVSHDDWVVERDSESVSSNACLAAMAKEYNIDLTNGQPAEPDRSECERERSAETTRYVVTVGGEMKEVEIYRYSHPKEDLSEDWDGNPISPADSPFPSYFLNEDGVDKYDSVDEMVRALKAADDTHSVHRDEEDAETASLHVLADLATHAHGTPAHYDLYQPEDETPFLLPLDGEDVEEDRYHLDADEWRNVIETGWVALTQTLADAWGKRAMLAALKDERDSADAILASLPHTVWVSLASSYGAGNCRQGTSSFLRSHGIDPAIVGALRADALLELEPDNTFARKACQLAALGIH